MVFKKLRRKLLLENIVGKDEEIEDLKEAKKRLGLHRKPLYCIDCYIAAISTIEAEERVFFFDLVRGKVTAATFNTFFTLYIPGMSQVIPNCPRKPISASFCLACPFLKVGAGGLQEKNTSSQELIVLAFKKGKRLHNLCQYR